MFRKWFASLRSTRPSISRPAARGRVPSVERLEDRSMMAVLVADVNNPRADIPGDHLFRQIHEAVAAASPGDRINVRYGTYEPFHVATDDLTIRSVQASPKPVIAAKTGTDAAVLINASGVTIKGLWIQIDVLEASPGFLNVEESGIVVRGGNNKILDNDVSGSFGSGIVLVGSQFNRVSNEIINNSVWGEGKFAYHVYNSEKSSFKRNTANGEFLVGYYIRESEHLDFRNNFAKRAGVGFFSNDSHENTFVGNSTQDTGIGYLLVRSNENRLSHNTARGSLQHGFFLNGSADNVMLGNLARSNRFDGFSLNNESSGNLLQGNISLNNGGDGFVLQNSADNQLVRNSAVSNDGAGFRLESGSGNFLRGNQAIRNEGSGFEIDRSSIDTLLVHNLAWQNDGWGYLVDAVLSEDSKYNRCKNNTQGGSRISARIDQQNVC